MAVLRIHIFHGQLDLLGEDGQSFALVDIDFSFEVDGELVRGDCSFGGDEVNGLKDLGLEELGHVVKLDFLHFRGY